MLNTRIESHSRTSALIGAIAILSLTASIHWIWDSLLTGYILIGTLLIILGSWPGVWNQTSNRQATSSTGIHLLCSSLPIIIVVLLYHRVLQSWWIADDPSILRHIIEYPLLDNFTDSNTWRAYMPNNLTPLLLLSLGIDYQLFDLAPAPYYAHQLVALCAVLLVGYILLIRLVSPFVATLALVIFVTSLPMATIVQQLMTRHYIDGLLFSLLTILFYIQAIKTQRPLWLLPSLLSYVLACTAKEIYVPLVLLLPWMVECSSHRQRIAYTLPFIAVAGLYTLWRLYMLKPGNVLSGYGTLYDADPVGLQGFLDRLRHGLSLDDPASLAVVLISCLSGLIFLLAIKDQRAKLLPVFISAALILAPLLAVANTLLPRMMILAAAFMAILGAIGLQALNYKPNTSTRLLTLALGLAWIGFNIQAMAQDETWGDRAFIERHRLEGRFILSAEANRTLLEPVGPHWFYTGLAWIRAHHLQAGKAPGICYDPCLCAPDTLDDAVVYRDGSLTPAAPESHRCARREAPLSIAITYDSKAGLVRWDLGPYREGRWSFLLEPGAARVPVPPSGHFPMYRPNALPLRVLYESPEDWYAVSPYLTIDPTAIEADGRIRIDQS